MSHMPLSTGITNNTWECFRLSSNTSNWRCLYRSPEAPLTLLEMNQSSLVLAVRRSIRYIYSTTFLLCFSLIKVSKSEFVDPWKIAKLVFPPRFTSCPCYAFLKSVPSFMFGSIWLVCKYPPPPSHPPSKKCARKIFKFSHHLHRISSYLCKIMLYIFHAIYGILEEFLIACKFYASIIDHVTVCTLMYLFRILGWKVSVRNILSDFSFSMFGVQFESARRDKKIFNLNWRKNVKSFKL